MSSSTILTLMSNDKREFTIEKEAAMKSNTLKNMVDEDCVLTVIPIPNIDSATLALVINFLEQAVVPENDDLKKFADNLEISTLFNLVNATNYLDIKELMDIVCQKLAHHIKDKSVEEVREIFNITNDFTPAEEEAVRAEYAWAFEP